MLRSRTGAVLLLAAMFAAGPAISYAAAAKPKPKKAAAAKPAAKPKAAANEGAAGGQVVTLKQYIKWAGPMGKVLIVLSIVGVFLILKQLFFLRRGVLAPKKTQQKLTELFNQKQIKGALEFCQKDGSVLATVVGAGLSEIRSGYDSMVQVMEDVRDEEAIKVNQSVGYLSLIGAVAPMVGLLGTVLGMIQAFSQIATSEGMAKPAELAASIQQALVTTCMGLIVAVPAVVAYAVFRNRAVRLMLEVGVLASDLTARFKGLRVTASAAAARPQPAAAKPAPAQPAPAKETEETQEQTDQASPEEEKKEGE